MHTLRALLLGLALVVPTPARAVSDRAPASDLPRVRPGDSRTAALLLEGLQRSDTLRALVERIETRDVIVYLQMQPSLRGRLAGSLTWVTATPHFRYVRVSLSPELSRDRAIAVLGHELQHALEAGNEPSVVDDETLAAFYRKSGIKMSVHNNGWDTEAARDTGDEVRKDLSTARAVHVTESVQGFDPREWSVVYQRARERAR